MFLVTGCGGGGSSGGGGTITTKADPFCSTVTSYPTGVTITGSAVYQYRTNGNGAVNGTPKPIRHAEIHVVNAAGINVQCGATDSNGDFSLVVPASQQLTLKVASRIIYGATQAYVLDNPSDKDYHFISSTFTSDSSKSIGTLTALATGSLEGGAFNILDKILDANNYLITNTANCNGSFASCIPFSQPPLVHVYWDAGVNPGSYFGAGAVSFYLPGQYELYILGGANGQVQGMDVDHFDDSIILHEYGHFIEDVFSSTDSPGGSHNGNSIIDARLAWGEGWANFFQAAITNNPVYRDTWGNTDGGGTGVFFNENIETPGNDIPLSMGEGNFREFSITRALWDAIDSANGEGGADSVTAPFNELWTVFAGSAGFASASYHFRNMGLFHTIQQGLAGATNWASIRAAENQRGDQTDYASGTNAGPCAAIPIQAANIPGGAPENGSTSRSNQFASNDFYMVYHPGGTFNFNLSYTTDAGNQADLDVYVFQEGYNFINSTKIVGQSTASPGAGAGPHTEQVLIALAAGYYMINIRVDTTSGLGNNTSYSMTLNGASLCPSN